MADKERQRVKLTDVAFGGDCIARIDNQVVFVSGGLPGEEVVIELTQSKKNFRRGRVVDVINSSPNRVTPRCPLFDRCGGCQWQHIDYPTQLELKHQVVADQLRRIGGFGETVKVNPTLGAEDPWHYRNHARFSSQEGQLGFLEENSHRFLKVDECHIAQPAINEMLGSLQGKLPNSHRPAKPLARPHRAKRTSAPPEAAEKRLAIRYGVNTGQLLIHPAPGLPETAYHEGQEHLEEKLLGRRYRLSAESFFQVNTRQAERLIGYVIGQLKPKRTDTLLDIYCGVGTFGLLLAQQVARVIGIEESAVALQDARHNARDLKNVEFLLGPAEDLMGTLDEPVDVAIIDPPRAGCKPQVVEALRRLRPKAVVYVSCDPATLARDLKLFCAEGCYRIEDVQPVDMFPQTYHVESIVLMTNSGLQGK